VIQQFVDRFMEAKPKLREKLLKEIDDYSCSYGSIVKAVVEAIGKPLDPERIQCIDWGDYQGTLCFVVGETGYQPLRHWGACVGYGSCSGCDTLEAIKDDGEPEDVKAEKLLTIALHFVQGLKPIHSEMYGESS